MDNLDNDISGAMNAVETVSFDYSLAAIRAKNPFLMIAKFPDMIRTVVLTTANTAGDIEIPSGARYMQLKGDGDYYVSRNGNAQTPLNMNATGATSAQGVQCIEQGSIFMPENFFFYVKDIHQISVVSRSDGRAVSAMFWCQE